MKQSACGVLRLGIGALVVVAVTVPPATAASKVEAKCASKLGKAVVKVAKTTAKELARCRAADISGKAVGSCPDAKNQAKIAKAKAKAISTAEKLCKSVCSVSTDVECIANALCPPIVTPSSGVAEQCSAGAKNQPFDMGNIGFPGPFCDAAIGKPLRAPGDIGACAAVISEDAGEALVAAVYGSITNASAISSSAQSCLAAISKNVQKLSAAVAKGVAKCRDAILKGKSAGNPTTCQFTDATLAKKAAKLEAKLDSALASACTDADILELDLCGNGVGNTASVIQAAACLKAAAREIADSSEAPVLRTYSPVSVIDAGYPPPARCGDGVVNQLPNAFALLGEECDGADDTACPGACLPPGDAFECTCATSPRMRLFADGQATDSDAGWTGNSHEQGVADLSGYITELSNCDCDAFDGPTCIGNTSDSVCDVSGFQAPSCSWDVFSGTTCDAHGNLDGKNENKDCYVCDEFSANAGAGCTDERDCQAQCYDSAGVAQGPCDGQSDCAAGEVCRGQCDRSQTCVIIPNGAPLPVSTAGAAVCAVQRFRTDVVGTRDLVTGAHEFNYRLFSVIHLGERVTRPCPVCGGFCVGGTKDLELCKGRCSASGDPCRFDVDCPSGEACLPESPDCPGGFCQLDLVCGAEPTTPGVGSPCNIEYEHHLFGSISNDCLPNPQNNITGQGFEIDYLPGTTGTLTLPSDFPCTAQGFELFDCPCPDDGGFPTKPNLCAPACNAPGPNFGVGCATGNGSGAGTTCAGGANAGKLCDEDTDCPSSTCSANPRHCIGDPAFDRFACTTNADCGGGTCEDACPGGRCVPLCVPTVEDPFDGICAAGPPLAHCAEPVFAFKNCLVASAQSGSCSATCSGSGDPCVLQSDCSAGETCAGPCELARDCEAGGDGIIGTSDDLVGSGACVLDDRHCYLDPLVATGGSTLNGEGDPENDFTVGMWCYTATINPGVNASAGFGGPGRVRQRGLNITNGFSAIP